MPPAESYIRNYECLTQALNRLKSDFPFKRGYPPYILLAKAYNRFGMVFNLRKKLYNRKYRKTVKSIQEGKAENLAIEINENQLRPDDEKRRLQGH